MRCACVRRCVVLLRWAFGCRKTRAHAHSALQCIQISELQADEWACLKQVRTTALVSDAVCFGMSELMVSQETNADEKFWRARLTEEAHWIVARCDALAVGLVCGRRKQPGNWLMQSLWVHAGWRSSGLAEKLVRSVCRLARSDGAIDIRLWVVDTHAGDRARSFYKRLGFRATGNREPRSHFNPDLLIAEYVGSCAVAYDGNDDC